MIHVPDPFIPGGYITIRDPEFVSRRKGHEHCPVCIKMRKLMLKQEIQQTEFVTAFAIIDPNQTLPPEPRS